MSAAEGVVLLLLLLLLIIFLILIFILLFLLDSFCTDGTTAVPVRVVGFDGPVGAGNHSRMFLNSKKGRISHSLSPPRRNGASTCTKRLVHSIASAFDVNCRIA